MYLALPSYSYVLAYYSTHKKKQYSSQNKIKAMSLRPSTAPPVQDMPPPGGYKKVIFDYVVVSCREYFQPGDIIYYT